MSAAESEIPAVMNATQLIAYLNAVKVGELEQIGTKLEEARRACLALDQPELADRLSEANRALEQADLKTYRKRIATVIAQLGHIK